LEGVLQKQLCCVQETVDAHVELHHAWQLRLSCPAASGHAAGTHRSIHCCPLMCDCCCSKGIPSSLEAYYQQAGRAGRDGLPARCCLMWTPQDFNVGLLPSVFTVAHGLFTAACLMSAAGRVAKRESPAPPGSSCWQGKFSFNE
jgi:hypothetical protein